MCEFLGLRSGAIEIIVEGKKKNTKLSLSTPRKFYSESIKYIISILTAALDASEGLRPRSSRFNPRGNNAGTHWIWGWVGPQSLSGPIGKENNLNVPDRLACNVRFTPTTIFRLQIRFSFNWDMTPRSWMVSFSNGRVPTKDKKHIVFQLRHALNVTLCNAACCGFLYEAMHKMEVYVE